MQKKNQTAQDPRNRRPELKNLSIFKFILVFIAVVLGAFLRLYFPLQADYPLHDGGLFHSMIEDIDSAGFALPSYTSFNQAEIPFAYPPGGFYMSLILHRLFHWPISDILRLLPAIITALTIPIFYLLSKHFLPNFYAIFATIAFALLPATYNWFILGGGIARAPGYLFALLTLHQAYLLYKRDESKFILSTMLLGTLTVVTHLVMAMFAAYSTGLFFLFFGRNRKGLIKSAIVAVGVTILSAPWWWTVIVRHGVNVFAIAFHSGFYSFLSSITSLINPVFILFIDEPVLDIFAVFGLLGILWSIRNKKYLFLLAWMVVVFVFQARFIQAYATVPFAMFFSIGLFEVVLPALNGKKLTSNLLNDYQGLMQLLNTRMSKFLIVYILIVGLFSGFVDTPKDSISDAHVTGMEWVGENIDPKSAFILLDVAHNPHDNEFGDREGKEWLPVIAQRKSVITPQGLEWISRDAFPSLGQTYRDLQVCSALGLRCLQDWIDEAEIQFTHIFYITDRQNPYLLQDLSAAPEYELLYDRPEVKIFSRK